MSATKTTLIATVVVIVTFLAGVAVGIFADRMLILHGHGARPRAERFATHMLAARLDRQLDLTEAQRAQVEDILERRHERMLALWAGVDPRVRAEIAGANEEIVKILTPEQRAKFERMKLRIHGVRGPHKKP